MSVHKDVGPLDRAVLETLAAEASESTARLADVLARLGQRERELREARDQLELARLDARRAELRVSELEPLLRSRAYRVARRLGDVRSRITL